MATNSQDEGQEKNVQDNQRKEIKAVIYSRASRDENKKGAIEVQKSLLRALAEENGFEIVEEVSEAGSEFDMNRSGIRKLKELAAEHRMDLVLVRDVSRITRMYSEYVSFEEELKGMGARILVADGSRDRKFEGVQEARIPVVSSLADPISEYQKAEAERKSALQELERTFIQSMEQFIDVHIKKTEEEKEFFHYMTDCMIKWTERE